MTDPNTTPSFAFLPWLRVGLATRIPARSAAPSTPMARVPMTIGVSLNEGAITASAALELVGPGDITGLDPAVVLRAWPRPDSFQAEPNHFPLLELAQADLPWRYTPTGPQNERLQPWLCLAVLKSDEMEAPTPSTPAQRLATVKVHEAASLPDLTQAWMWAHVQASGMTSIDAPGAADLYATHPTSLIARLLCARALDPDTAYTALLVPTLERSRLAGLGLGVPDSVDAMTGAWTASAKDVVLPIYYQWRFRTGPSGDFESLVKQLVARDLPSTVGWRSLNVGAPGLGLPGASATPLGLEGALQAQTVKPPAWQDAARAAWTTSLTALLDAPADRLGASGTDPRVTPPLYAQWQAGLARLDANAPPWFAELNIDPTTRVAAGLGARVVMNQQEALMASAWDQAKGLLAINEQLRFAQLAYHAALRLYERHLQTADDETHLHATAQVHARVVAGSRTVSAQLVASPIAPGALDPAWRRMSRPLGPIGRRQKRALGAASAPTFLMRMNGGVLPVAPSPPTPSSMATVSAALKIVGAPPGPIRVLPARAAAPRATTAAATTATVAAPGSPLPRPRPVPLPDPTTFASAASDALARFDAVPRSLPPLVAVKLSRVRSQLGDALHPDKTIAAAVARRLHLSSATGPPGAAAPFRPVMAAPSFPQAMYAPLAAMSQEWLLPGLAAVPSNTVAVALANPRFIEAYMAGLNFEMGRVLLWNGYPTDLRATYFQRFWESSGRSPAAGPDIPPIASWSSGAALGNIAASDATPDLVLLVRGTLLQRYPDTSVYAVRAVPATGGGRDLGTEEKHPLFRGALPSDLSFFGFDLTVATAIGTGQGADLGWYFVLAEHSSAPRFGVDVTAPSPPPAADAAQFAKNMFLEPFRIAVHASQLLSKPTGPG